MLPKNRSALLVLALALAACGLPSKQQRIQEAAYELNMTLRFASADGTLDKVVKDSRTKFIARHKLWHGKIKIDDIELTGLSLREDGDANLFLTVGWHKADESDVRTSVVLQRWHDEKGSWMLADESHAQGDIGLFGEPIVHPIGEDDPQSPSRDLQFRTTVIRTSQ